MSELTMTTAEIRAVCRYQAWALLQEKPPRSDTKRRRALARAIQLLLWPERDHDCARY